MIEPIILLLTSIAFGVVAVGITAVDYADGGAHDTSAARGAIMLSAVFLVTAWVWIVVLAVVIAVGMVV